MTVLDVDRALYSILAPIFSQRVYYGLAPMETAYPMAVIALVDSDERIGVGACRVMSVETWQVTVWTDSRSFLPVETLAESVIAALHNQRIGNCQAVYQSQARAQEDDDARVFHGIILEFMFYKEV